MALAEEPRKPLSRDRVLHAAVALADDAGLGALSMRRLGQELGVEAMSLYNHVANKDDLLDGITGVVLGEIELPDDGDWKEALRRHALSAHGVFRRHPWACNLALSPDRTVPVSVRRADWMLGCLRGAGFSPELTYHAYHALDAHILGFTLWELGHGVVDSEELAQLAETFFRQFPPADYPHMHEHAQQHMTPEDVPGNGAFETVLDLILDGIERFGDRR